MDGADLSVSAKEELLPGGKNRLRSRLGWTIAHSARAGFLEQIARGQYRITENGRSFLREYPTGMTYGEAHRYFSKYWPQRDSANDVADEDPAVESAASESPDEVMDAAQNANHRDVAEELLSALRELDPSVFEEVVVDLLLKMGYGGAEKRGQAIGRANDGGVDGVIDEDALGLDKIYIQAKRYAEGNTVGRESIQAFIGALHGHAASKGVFLTTSAFTSGAKVYAQSIPTHVVLIDGQRLTRLMIDYRVGVQTQQTFTTVRVDLDYFA